MKKHLFLTSLAAIITTIAGANAATDVAFSGNYTNANGVTVNISDAVANQSYSYEKSDGSTRNVADQSTEPTLTDFTYTDKDGNDADLSAGAKSRSDFTGTSSVTGVVSTSQEIVSGKKVVRDNYTYTNGAGDNVVLGTAAQDMVKNVELNTTYANGHEIVVTNDEVPETVNGEWYQVTVSDKTYHLSADGSKLVDSDDIEVTPTTGSPLDDAFTAMKEAFATDTTAVAEASVITTGQWSTEQDNFSLADNAFTTDTATVAALDTRWESYETAAALLTKAQDKQKDAKTAYTDNSDSLTNALAVYNAPITTTIDGAIDASVESGSVKTALDGKANSADVYTKDAADARFLTEHQDISGKANSADVYTKDAADARFLTEHQDISGKADVAYVNSGLELKANASDVELALDGKADKATTLAGYGITDAYTKDDVNGLINVEKSEREAADASLKQQIAGIAADLQSADINVLHSANAYTDKKVNALEKDMSGGVAAATALSAVSVGNVGRGEVSVGGGYGYYNGQSAMAFGAAMGLSNRWSINAGAGIASGDSTQFSIRAGTNYKFKLF